MFGAFLAGVAVAAFGYFVYKKIKEQRDSKAATGGSRPSDGSSPRQK
jgi:hypothetical protein